MAQMLKDIVLCFNSEDTSAFPAGFLAACMRRIQSEFEWPDDGMAVYRDAKECMKVLMEILRYRPMVNSRHLFSDITII